MSEVTTIGLVLAKNVFQVYGVDASGEAVIRRQLRRCQVIPFFRQLWLCLMGVGGVRIILMGVGGVRIIALLGARAWGARP